ncbi:MAG: hypothetical protein R2939_16755 [Kofleriaceae bacterium]
MRVLSGCLLAGLASLTAGCTVEDTTEDAIDRSASGALDPVRDLDTLVDMMMSNDGIATADPTSALRGPVDTGDDIFVVVREVADHGRGVAAVRLVTVVRTLGAGAKEHVVSDHTVDTAAISSWAQQSMGLVASYALPALPRAGGEVEAYLITQTLDAKGAVLGQATETKLELFLDGHRTPQAIVLDKLAGCNIDQTFNQLDPVMTHSGGLDLLVHQSIGQIGCQTNVTLASSLTPGLDFESVVVNYALAADDLAVQTKQLAPATSWLQQRGAIIAAMPASQAAADEPAMLEVLLNDADGQVIGAAHVHFTPKPGAPVEFLVHTVGSDRDQQAHAEVIDGVQHVNVPMVVSH